VRRYFEALPTVWEQRTNKIAQGLVVGLYPSFRIEQSTLDLTDEFLATQRPPALRRLLLESRDGIVRAMRARECDHARA
jgi:aminopeptidase N